MDAIRRAGGRARAFAARAELRLRLLAEVRGNMGERDEAMDGSLESGIWLMVMEMG